MQTYRIDFGYDGTAFWGSQRQPGARTVQEALETALGRLTGRDVRVALAGRTDRGVHAVGQVASVQLRWSRGEDALGLGLAALTPDDIVIYAARVVDAGFHARFSARSRAYRYRIWQGPTRPPLLMRGSVWAVRDVLDLPAMREASRDLIGRHDFASVAGSGVGSPGSGVNCVRTVFDCEVVELEQSIEPTGAQDRLIEVRITGDAFLPQMVRNIVGDLILIGRRQRPVAWLGELIEARDRRLGAPPAPATGLVLWRVGYDSDEAGRRGSQGVSGNQGANNDQDILAQGVRDPA